jgi:hypothetical protein
MAWERFGIKEYEVYLVAHNTPGYLGVYAQIDLFWQEKKRATLWYYRDDKTSVQENGSHISGGVLNYYGRFSQDQFRDSIDLLRNEKPVFFSWNEETKGVRLSTSGEPVGEEELPPS